MSEDLGYSTNELEWACGSGGSVLKSRHSNWLAWMGAFIGTLALGATIYAFFMPRDEFKRLSRKVKRAVKHGEHEVRETADELLEGVAKAVHHSGPDGHRN